MSFELGKRAFAYYNTKIHDWYAPSGEYRIVIGASSRELRLRAAVQIESTAKLPVHYSAHMTVGQLITAEKGEQFIWKVLFRRMGLSSLPPAEQPDIADCPEQIAAIVRETMMGMPLASMVTYGALSEEELNTFLMEMNEAGDGR